MQFSFVTKTSSKSYMIVIERGDTSYGAHVPALPGCVAIGKTESEAKSLIQEAIELHLEDIGAS